MNQLLRFFLASSFLLLCGFATSAQSTIRFTVQNTQKEPVAFATVKAVAIVDSATILQKITDSSGIAVFELPAAVYRVTVSAINYTTLQKTLTITAGNNMFLLSMEASSKTLNNVVVTSSRPAIRQEDDKTIVDPENLAASSTNAFEIMEK